MKKRPVAIKQVVDGILKDLGAGRAAQADTLSDLWQKAVGENGVKHARPVDVKEGILVVHVDSSGWLHKLTMEKTEILRQIIGGLGEGSVKDIKLRIGEI